MRLKPQRKGKEKIAGARTRLLLLALPCCFSAICQHRVVEESSAEVGLIRFPGWQVLLTNNKLAVAVACVADHEMLAKKWNSSKCEQGLLWLDVLAYVVVEHGVSPGDVANQ